MPLDEELRLDPGDPGCTIPIKMLKVQPTTDNNYRTYYILEPEIDDFREEAGEIAEDERGDRSNGGISVNGKSVSGGGLHLPTMLSTNITQRTESLAYDQSLDYLLAMAMESSLRLMPIWPLQARGLTFE